MFSQLRLLLPGYVEEFYKKKKILKKDLALLLNPRMAYRHTLVVKTK